MIGQYSELAIFGVPWCDEHRGRYLRGHVPQDMLPAVEAHRALCERVAQQGRCDEGGIDVTYAPRFLRWVDGEFVETGRGADETIRRCRHGNMVVWCPHYRGHRCELREEDELVSGFFVAFDAWIESGCPIGEENT